MIDVLDSCYQSCGWLLQLVLDPGDEVDMAYIGTREDAENQAVNDGTEAERLMMMGGQRSREVGLTPHVLLQPYVFSSQRDTETHSHQKGSENVVVRKKLVRTKILRMRW